MLGADGYLYSLVLKLIPQTGAWISPTMGHQVQAAFLQAIKEADPDLATALHCPDLPVRPFTVSPLRGARSYGRKRITLDSEKEYFLRFTVLHQVIFQRFMERFLEPQNRPAIRLGKASLLIKEILVTPGSHPWAGYTSWTELINRDEASSEITLEFASPTAFSFGQKPWGKMTVPLPEPRLVFGSLLRTWNSLAPASLRMDKAAIKDYIEESVVIKRIENLKTAMLRFPDAPQVGFVGRVTFGLMADEEPVRSRLNTLADFAFYAGVGMKTAMGMGMVRRVQSPES